MIGEPLPTLPTGRQAAGRRQAGNIYRFIIGIHIKTSRSAVLISPYDEINGDATTPIFWPDHWQHKYRHSDLDRL